MPYKDKEKQRAVQALFMKMEYLIFERFGNRYDFIRSVKGERTQVAKGRYYVVEAHKLFVPPRIGGREGENEL